MNKKQKLLVAIVMIFAVIFGILLNYKETGEIDKNEVKKVVDMTQNAIIDYYDDSIPDYQPTIVTDETQEIVDETIEATFDGEDVSTTEVIKGSEEEELEVTDEGALEEDAVIEQENISYDGTNTGNGLNLLDAYQGLTYYSQADSRWANLMYSSIGDSSQTMKSSACGPTSAAMIVSSSKGAILPTTMANLAVDNGYRTAGNGPAWAYFPFVADYFDFKEFYTTGNFNTAIDYLKTDKDNDGNADYYIIVSCGTGLFTTGGHYIVLVGDNDGTITVYDPYLYSGKFNTASRRNAGVIVSGNSAFVSEEAFRNYSNYKCFWIYSNDTEYKNEAKSAELNLTRYVATQSLNLLVRENPNGTILNRLAKGTQVNVVELAGEWARINSPYSGWVHSEYLSASPVITISNTVGNYYRLKTKSILYSNSNLTGIQYSYLAQTQIKVLENVTENIDKVQVVKTGRIAYINKSAYTITGASG